MVENQGERVKYIRKHYNYSQKDFGERLGITDTAISKLERGDRNPSDQTILSICREFNVNEDWLRTGDGEPFIEMSREDEIMAFLGKTFSDDKNNFTKDMIYALSKLNKEQMEVLQEVADLILNKKN